MHTWLFFKPWTSHHRLHSSDEKRSSSKYGQVTFSWGSIVFEVPAIFSPSNSVHRSQSWASYGVVEFSYGQIGASVHVSFMEASLNSHQRRHAVTLFGSVIYGHSVYGISLFESAVPGPIRSV